MAQIEKEKGMPPITSIERIWLRTRDALGIQSLLVVRFGAEGLKLMPEVENIHSEYQLQAIITAAETASDLEEVRRLLSSFSQ